MSLCVQVKVFPIVAGVHELDLLDKRRGSKLIRVDCRDLADIGETRTPEETDLYGHYFALKAREYDDALIRAGCDHDAVVIHCHAGLHRSVSVAIVWSVWRNVCNTTSAAQAAMFRLRGTEADALPGYASAVDKALELLHNNF